MRRAFPNTFLGIDMLTLQFAVVRGEVVQPYGEPFRWPVVPRAGETVKAPDEAHYEVLQVLHHVGTDDPIYLVIQRKVG